MNFSELTEKIETSLKDNIPFVAYRKHSEDTITTIFQRDATLTISNDFSLEGFVFAPFILDNGAVLFLKKDCTVDTVKFISNKAHITNTECLIDRNDEIQHKNLIEKTIRAIKEGRAEKIVVSRKESVTITSSVSDIFENLLSIYANAFVYVWYHPKIGLWLGATPEKLLRIDDQKFTTMALAGTQVSNDLSIVKWNRKELDEQQFVTDYIKTTLEDKVTNLQFSKPYTIKAGNLLHLQTDISGVVEGKKDQSLLISTLHPTPAVCGLPKDVALQFIQDNEGYDREYYTGFLGELNMENRTELFVNLRCMKVVDTTASIFIGGGITKDSTPENEWNETVAKSKTIMKAL